MTYEQALNFLFGRLPMYQRIGPAAYKADLLNTELICRHLGNPERKFRSIHVAGTNGKGSTSHMLAAIFQCAGYKTGLYTSPHLKDFTERIKINGIPVSKGFVTRFVDENRSLIEEVSPSFFEMTVGMAFQYFADQKVDIAIIETGLGGRLDSTNVIVPELSLITNISLDHTDLLGDTLVKIANEKAGIIKPNVPVVIGEKHELDEVNRVFINKAQACKSPIVFSAAECNVQVLGRKGDHARYGISIGEEPWLSELKSDLNGVYQLQNIQGVLASVLVLRKGGWKLGDQAVLNGIEGATNITGLKGRFQKIGDRPLIICDTGHNEAGIQSVFKQLMTMTFKNLWVVFGMNKEKQPASILNLLPRTANYIFCQANIPRAQDADTLLECANKLGLKGVVVKDVNEALALAKSMASVNDMIFVGGSTFVVAELKDI